MLMDLAVTLLLRPL